MKKYGKEYLQALIDSDAKVAKWALPSTPTPFPCPRPTHFAFVDNKKVIDIVSGRRAAAERLSSNASTTMVYEFDRRAVIAVYNIEGRVVYNGRLSPSYYPAGISRLSTNTRRAKTVRATYPRYQRERGAEDTIADAQRNAIIEQVRAPRVAEADSSDRTALQTRSATFFSAFTSGIGNG